ncbi:Ni/Fe-hydrogenase cytochrome b subunit, partial [bacterium]|nr:Ni/Fe-hydrogenase cytochrome b subunit [bacterium]
GIIAPILLLLSEKIRRNPATLLFAVSLVIFGIIINRINVFIIAYKPLYADKVYVPAWTEVLLTVGFMSILILLYRTYVFIFPVLEMEEQGSDV